MAAGRRGCAWAANRETPAPQGRPRRPACGQKNLRRERREGLHPHEFSHIPNGDMRLNMRLIGWVYGILCLTIIGKTLLRSGGRRNALPLAGLVLLAVGAVGAFFGRLIQSAVSRQREFLADASAAQFTRNPEGLAGAFK